MEMTLQKVVMTDPKQQDYCYEEAIKTLRTNIQFYGNRDQDYRIDKLLSK